MNIMDEIRDENRSAARSVAVTAMALMVTESCNFRCSYCYGSYGIGQGTMMDLATARKAVDWLMEHSQNEKTLRIVFFGGEPLMNFPLIREITPYIRDIAQGKGKSVNLEITTNASLIDDEVIDFFFQHHIVPLISFDGPKEVQDLQRTFRNGKGSYDHTIPRVRKLLNKIPRTACRATWLPGTDPDLVVHGLREIGFWKIFLVPVTMSSFPKRNGKGTPVPVDLTPLIRQAERDAIQIRQYIENRDAEGVRVIGMASPLLSIIRLLLTRAEKNPPCGAGFDLVGISTRGDLYPCHRFLNIPGFQLGNIFDQHYSGWFNRWRDVDEMPACRECLAGYTCRGGCYHDNFVATGDYTLPSMEMCRRKVALTLLAEALLKELDEADLEFLSQEKLLHRQHCMLDFG